MPLSPDEATFLFWFHRKLLARHAAGDPADRFDLRDYRHSLPLSEPRSWDVAANLAEKGLLKATPQSFHWDGPKGGGADDWFELELTEAGKAEVKRLRRWWLRWISKLWPRAMRPGSRAATCPHAGSSEARPP